MTLTLPSLDAMAALDVCDVAIAKLAVTERLAGRSHVDHCLANRKFKKSHADRSSSASVSPVYERRNYARVKLAQTKLVVFPDLWKDEVHIGIY
jgi:hypothetical protein